MLTGKGLEGAVDMQSKEDGHDGVCERYTASCAGVWSWLVRWFRGFLGDVTITCVWKYGVGMVLARSSGRISEVRGVDE